MPVLPDRLPSKTAKSIALCASWVCARSILNAAHSVGFACPAYAEVACKVCRRQSVAAILVMGARFAGRCGGVFFWGHSLLMHWLRLLCQTSRYVNFAQQSYPAALPGRAGLDARTGLLLMLCAQRLISAAWHFTSKQPAHLSTIAHVHE